MTTNTFVPVSPADALKRLKEGNERFVKNTRSVDVLLRQMERKELAKVQRPFAIILSCSDSRAPSELLFDQGLGDLFVIRVAGNIIAPSLVGSVEFAAATFGTQLVVVMGHSGCGAVTATLQSIRDKKQAPSENIQDIIQRIKPHVESLVKLPGSEPEILQEAIRCNVNASVHQLRHGSRILEDLERTGKLKVIGAEYCLESGRVEFLGDL